MLDLKVLETLARVCMIENAKKGFSSLRTDLTVILEGFKYFILLLTKLVIETHDHKWNRLRRDISITL